MNNVLTEAPPNNQLWADEVYELCKQHGVRAIAYVPDGGHRRLIERATHDDDMHSVLLTTEEEGVALCAGADLGHGRAILLMQSSGVGNCVNAFSLLGTGDFPFLTLVSMRGEAGEQNRWQNPMGQAVDTVLETMGVEVRRVESSDDIIATLDGALRSAFEEGNRVAVLLTQKLMGAKQF